MNGRTLVSVAVFALVVVVCAARFWPGDERMIRKQLVLIETAGSKAPAEQPVEALLKGRQLAELFHDPCRLTVEAAGRSGDYPPRQIMDHLNMTRAYYTRVSVSLHDIAIDLAKETAVVRCTLRLRGEAGGEQIADVHEIRAEMHKDGGKWLLTAVEIVQILER